MDFPTRPIFELLRPSKAAGMVEEDAPGRLAPLVPTQVKCLVQSPYATLVGWQERIGLVAFVASNCNTASDRDVYVSELMRHIRVDSYGACLHNMDFPKEADPDNPVNSRENNDFAIGKNAVTRRCAMRSQKIPSRCWHTTDTSSCSSYRIHFVTDLLTRRFKMLSFRE